MKILLLADGGDTELQAFKSVNETTVTIQIEDVDENQDSVQCYSLNEEDLTELIDELIRLRKETFGQ